MYEIPQKWQTPHRWKLFQSWYFPQKNKIPFKGNTHNLYRIAFSYILLDTVENPFLEFPREKLRQCNNRLRLCPIPRALLNFILYLLTQGGVRKGRKECMNLCFLHFQPYSSFIAAETYIYFHIKLFMYVYSCMPKLRFRLWVIFLNFKT